MMCNGHTDASMQGQTDLKIEMVMSKINFCHCINGGGGSCSRLGAQFIIEARILGAQSHHFIYLLVSQILGAQMRTLAH